MSSPLSGPEVFGEWLVFSDYEVTDGYLQRKGLARTGHYRPQDHEELPFAFAKLVDSSNADLVRFARQWGALGYEWLWWMEERAEAPDLGDPLDWIQLHARYAALCISLIDALTRGDKAVVTQAVEKYLEPDLERKPWEEPTKPLPRAWGLRKPPYDPFYSGEKLSPLRWVWSRPGGEIEALVWAETLATDPLRVARTTLRDIITRHIHGIHPWFILDTDKAVPLRPGESTLAFGFRAMIEVVYLHIARLATAGQQIDRCQECGALFKKQHGNQRFCAPGPYDSESRCSYRHRYRRYSGAKPTGNQQRPGSTLSNGDGKKGEHNE